ncbi:gamma tubulin complex subunit Alp16 [Schizosaccharomyces octosporus yFS286]|uniref:Gamma tubulin complex subunit Alp16 n=1 Tax=Schizosaccharomyces octosporus (strain yFS286) TaxID=483514 RepID=S9RCJ7_SCHOY|nr:gamma tubulin complex subunit Alp16 [Schizosaccharomyces octosporus yFS286]EPX71839.1 gamma tubulin complex subunit Alp16 [Schizosaccharomyces octosporus yFS286]
MNVGRKSDLFPFETCTRLPLPSLEPTLLQELGVLNENENAKRKYHKLSAGLEEFSLAKDHTLLGKDAILGVSTTSSIEPKRETTNENIDGNYYFLESVADRKRIKSQSPDLDSACYNEDAFIDSNILGCYSNWEGTNYISKEAKTPFFSECPALVYDAFLHEDGSPEASSVLRLSSQQVYLALCALVQGFETCLFFWDDENATFRVPNLVSMSGTSQLSFSSFVTEFISFGTLVRNSIKKIKNPISIGQFYLFNFCANGITQYRKELQSLLLDFHSPIRGPLSLLNYIRRFDPLFRMLKYVLSMPPSRQDTISIMNALYDYTIICQNTRSYPIALECFVYCSDPFFLKLNAALDFTVTNKRIQHFVQSFPNFFPSELSLLLAEFLNSFTMVQQYPVFFETLRPKLATSLKVGFSLRENLLFPTPNKSSIDLSANAFPKEKQNVGEEDNFEALLEKMNMTPNIDDEVSELHFVEGPEGMLPLGMVMQLCIYNPIQDYILVLMRTLYESLFTQCFASEVLRLLQNVCCFQSPAFVDETMCFLRDDFFGLDDSYSLEHAFVAFASFSKQCTSHEMERLGFDKSASSNIQLLLHYNEGEIPSKEFGALGLKCKIYGPLQMLFPKEILELYSKIFSMVSFFFEQKVLIEYEFQHSRRLWEKKVRIEKWLFYQNIKSKIFDLIHVVIPETIASFTGPFLSLSSFSSDRPVNIFSSEINGKHKESLMLLIKEVEAKLPSIDEAQGQGN